MNVFGDTEERGLRLETIERALGECTDHQTLVAVALACRDIRIGSELVYKWKRSNYGPQLLAAIYAMGDMATFGMLEKSIFNYWDYGAPYALMACRHHEIPVDWFEYTLDGEHDPKWVAPRACAYQKISRGTIRRWLQSANPYRRAAAMYAAMNAHVPAGWLHDGLDDPCTEVTTAAVRACNKHQVPSKLLEKWWNKADRYLQVDILRVCEMQQQELGDYKALVYGGLSSKSQEVALAAARACRGKYDIPVDVITSWLESRSFPKVMAAMYASMWRDDCVGIPQPYVNDPNVRIRKAARAACLRPNPKMVSSVLSLGGDTNKLLVNPAHPIRDFEPEDVVFRPCLNDVVVVAKIPRTVDVYGEYGRMCRAYAAKIVDIRGELYGEKVGISDFDLKTQFRVGDIFVGMDFDIGGMNDRAGFWFVCSPVDIAEAWGA